jgi:hypothetical protein
MTTIMHADIKMLDGKILYGLGLSSPIFGVGASRAVHEGTIDENPTPREDRPTGKYVDNNNTLEFKVLWGIWYTPQFTYMQQYVKQVEESSITFSAKPLHILNFTRNTQLDTLAT